jgi:predicted RNase H-like HicB family nuclease
MSLVLASATLLGSAAFVQAEGLTREQVKAELAEAIRTGTIVLDKHGRSEYELAPHRYPARPAVVGKTRSEVKKELAEAIRTGAIVRGEHGRSEYELAPHRYPARPTVVGKTRDEVKEELAEAIRLGNAPIDDIGRTPADIFPATYASVRAEHALAMKARQSERTAQGASEGTEAR